jgi:predicted transcriptional regulator
MIRQVSDVMDRNFLVVGALDGVSLIKRLALERRIDYFPVMENGKLIGVVTYKDLMWAHPNRIAADAMTQNFLIIGYDMSIWEVRSLYEHQGIDLFIVEDNNKIIGLITSSVLDIEFGKHFDLLTGSIRPIIFFTMPLNLSKKKSRSPLFLSTSIISYY